MRSVKISIKRWLPLFVMLLVLAASVAIATPSIAAYVKTTGEEGSEYVPAEPADPSFQLNAEKKTMKNVKIAVEDKGYPVYVRAAILITWQSPEPDGEVYFAEPQEGTDYTVTMGEGWEKIDGFYYCTSSVASGGTTSALIESFSLKDGAELPEEGCVLSVEIIVQTVQAIGYTDKDENGKEIPAWQDAWGITSLGSPKN